MSPMQRIVFRICFILALVAAFGPRASAAVVSRTYVVTDLGSLGGLRSAASDINEFGQVVGWSGTSSGSVNAFLWHASGGMRDLGTLGGSRSEARRISHDGLVVGGSYNDSGAWRPFLWDGRVMHDLRTLGGPTGDAIGINVAGDAVGWSSTTAGLQRATLWSGDSIRDLGSLGGDSSASQASDINTSGDVVGKSYTPLGGQIEHAFIWSATTGVMQDLGTLGGTHSGASAINKNNQVVGSSSTSGGNPHAFIWSASGGMQDLGTLGGAVSVAADINTDGQVVGSSLTADGVEHAFLYSEGVMSDLNNMLPDGDGWVLRAAAAINDQGQIVGAGLYNGATRAFLLTPDQFPVAGAGGPYWVVEGGSVALNASGSDADGDPLTYAWDLDNNGTFETAGQTTTFSAAGRDGPSQQAVSVKVCDDKRACSTATSAVTIDNAVPVVGQISATSQRSKGKLTVSASASFSDAGTADTHTATWSWGDGTSTMVSLPSGTRTVSASHTYPDSESYTITLSVTDGDDTGQSTIVVGGRTRK